MSAAAARARAIAPLLLSQQPSLDREEQLLSQAYPILKWAGGKAAQVDTILSAIDRLHPEKIETYYEPFAGGLAVFFALARAKRFKHAVISDSNAELIEMYKAVRDEPKKLIKQLESLLLLGFNEEAYYAVRAASPKVPAARAARMIYLNKTGFNGLYRVNKSGGFNVPWGKRKNPTVYTEEAIGAASFALQGVEFRVSFFQYMLFDALKDPKAFAYLDPPYVPVSKSSDFTAYGKDGFDMEQQEILAVQLRRIADNGGNALLSNSHCPATLKLYQGLVRHRVAARRNINSKGDKRGPVSELLVESRLNVRKKKI